MRYSKALRNNKGRHLVYYALQHPKKHLAQELLPNRAHRKRSTFLCLHCLHGIPSEESSGEEYNGDCQDKEMCSSISMGSTRCYRVKLLDF